MTEQTQLAPAPAHEDERGLPRWVGRTLLLVCLALFASTAGVFAYLRTVGNSADLKKATSLTLYYTLKPQTLKRVEVTDPAQVKDLLDALDITHTDPGMVYGIKPVGYVEFRLPDRTFRCNFFSKTQLDRANWGQVYVSPRFYEKVCDVASRAEGRRIDVLVNGN